MHFRVTLLREVETGQEVSFGCHRFGIDVPVRGTGEGMIESIVRAVAWFVIRNATSIPIMQGAVRNGAAVPIFSMRRTINAVYRAWKENVAVIFVVCWPQVALIAAVVVISDWAPTQFRAAIL